MNEASCVLCEVGVDSIRKNQACLNVGLEF